MRKDERIIDEKAAANNLRKEIMKSSEIIAPPSADKKIDFQKIEYISEQKQPYISPIMTMNEDEILDFVESFEVSELATLSVAELNRIGEVLGVPIEILKDAVEE